MLRKMSKNTKKMNAEDTNDTGKNKDPRGEETHQDDHSARMAVTESVTSISIEDERSSRSNIGGILSRPHFHTSAPQSAAAKVTLQASSTVQTAVTAISNLPPLPFPHSPSLTEASADNTLLNDSSKGQQKQQQTIQPSRGEEEEIILPLNDVLRHRDRPEYGQPLHKQYQSNDKKQELLLDSFYGKTMAEIIEGTIPNNTQRLNASTNAADHDLSSDVEEADEGEDAVMQNEKQQGQYH